MSEPPTTRRKPGRPKGSKNRAKSPAPRKHKLPAKRGPKGYSEEQRDSIAENIFNAITFDNLTVAKACKEANIPEKTYYHWIKTYDEMGKFSARAREIAGLKHGQRAAETLDEVRAGTLDPQAGRLLFDGHLRLAGKLNQGIYGETTKLDVSVSGKASLTDHILAKAREADVIEVE